VNFDARTLLVLGGFLCWILAAAIEFQAVRPSGRRVMPDAWTLGLLLKGMGLNLISQRGLIPDVWSISLAHGLLLAGLIFFYVAIQRIRGAATSILTIAVMPVTVAILLPVIGFTQDQFQHRVLLIMSAWIYGFCLSCWSALQVARAGYVAGASLILVSNGVLALIAVAFGIAVMTREVPGVFAGSSVQIAFYAINDVCILVGTLGYMDIVRIAQIKKAPTADDALKPDALTGLYSAPAFSKISSGELSRAAQRGYPVCVMVLRIDRFDEVKAMRGPAFVDRALQRVASRVQSEIRAYDVAGRISTELVAVVMPERALKAAIDVAERIRDRVASEFEDSPGEQGIAISVGLCEADSGGLELEALLAVAGSCLDRARADGGNRVVALPRPPVAHAVQVAT
jgi:diguanylate cyclase (GGDEF)-like protein